MSDFYADKTDMEIARFINLALLLNDGISDDDAGLELCPCINQRGLDKLASIIRDVRAAARSEHPTRPSEAIVPLQQEEARSILGRAGRVGT